jgi:hypothetical protein
VRTVLTKSLERNLNRRNSDKSMALPTKGNRIACSLDIVSCVRRNGQVKLVRATHNNFVSTYLLSDDPGETLKWKDQREEHGAYSGWGWLDRTVTAHVHSKTCRQYDVQIRVHVDDKRRQAQTCTCQNTHQDYESANIRHEAVKMRRKRW